MNNNTNMIMGTVHDLRTPLNGIKGHVHYLMEQSDDETVRRELEIINKSCQDMERLISNVLDYGKLGEGQVALSIDKLSIRELMADIYNSQVKAVEAKDLEFVYFVDEDVPDILFGDAFRIKQVIGNLLTNSVKFTRVGYVGLFVSGDYISDDEVMLHISVVDTGEGIEPEKIEVVFKPYAQAGDAVAKTFGGTGLGLFVVRQFVDLMEGSVTVDAAVRRGCSFTANLKLKSASQVSSNLSGEKVRKYIEDIYEKSDDIKRFGSQRNKELTKRLLGVLTTKLGGSDLYGLEDVIDAINVLLQDSEQYRKKALALSMAIRGGKNEKAMGIIKELEDIYD